MVALGFHVLNDYGIPYPRVRPEGSPRQPGVLEAARRVHDEHIGVGRAFHPFRLPEIMEQRLPWSPCSRPARN